MRSWYCRVSPAKSQHLNPGKAERVLDVIENRAVRPLTRPLGHIAVKFGGSIRFANAVAVPVKVVHAAHALVDCVLIFGAQRGAGIL